MRFYRITFVGGLAIAYELVRARYMRAVADPEQQVD